MESLVAGGVRSDGYTARSTSALKSRLLPVQNFEAIWEANFGMIPVVDALQDGIGTAVVELLELESVSGMLSVGGGGARIACQLR